MSRNSSLFGCIVAASLCLAAFLALGAFVSFYSNESRQAFEMLAVAVAFAAGPFIVRAIMTRRTAAARTSQRPTPSAMAAPSRPTPPPPPKPQPDAWTFEGKGEFATDIVGESHYASEIHRAIGTRKPWEERCTIECLILPDRNNRYDDHAVAILHNVPGGGTLGHLSRERAKKWRPVLDTLLDSFNVAVLCDGIIHGREGGPFGVFIDIDLKDIRKELTNRTAGKHLTASTP